MIEAFQFAACAVLVTVAWQLPRWVAGSRWNPIPTLLDAAPYFLGAPLLILTTGRPIFSGIIVFALAGGFTLADWTMRETLREPAVFSEISELPQVFTHPAMYLPFAGPALVIGGAVGAVAVALALLVFEPPASPPQPAAGFGALGLILAGVWLVSMQPLLGIVAGLMRRLEPSGDPAADAVSLGPLAMQLVHCAIARAERSARRQALGAPPGAPAILRSEGDRAGPLILVQCESFFDARRLSPLVPREILSGYEACCRAGAMHGRLEVPGWGANTMRTEFAVLAGTPEAELGYDRFNPYYALARVPLASHVWRLRHAGYRTICLHPFSRRFFRRDLVLPALGFECFLGREVLGGSRAPPYHSDRELARQVLRAVDDSGPRSFIFVITMGNHGPWPETGGPLDPSVADNFDPTDVPQGSELRRYLDGLRQSDAMLEILMAGLAERGTGGRLAWYGDHLPSLPRAFDHFGFREPHSDYVIWPASDAPGVQADLPAHRLGDAFLAPLFAECARPARGKTLPRGPDPGLGACLAGR